MEKGLVIQEKDKLYSELKAILARQPGPEVAEQLNVYQQNLKLKTRQMKAMASEVNMYQAQVNEYKYELERCNRELQDMKRSVSYSQSVSLSTFWEFWKFWKFDCLYHIMSYHIISYHIIISCGPVMPLRPPI